MIALIFLPFAIGTLAELAFWLFVWQYDTDALIELEKFDMT